MIKNFKKNYTMLQLRAKKTYLPVRPNLLHILPNFSYFPFLQSTFSQHTPRDRFLIITFESVMYYTVLLKNVEIVQ